MPIEIIKGNFLDVEWWNDADVVYLANAVFGDELMRQLTERVCRMKVGARVASLKPLEPQENV